MKGVPAIRLLAAGLSLLAAGCNDKQVEAPPPGPVYTLNRVTLPAAVPVPAIASVAGSPRSVGSLLNVPLAMSYGDWKWDDDGVPAGDTWILVDLAAQTMSVFRGAHEIGTAITLYGVDHKPTPTGRFTVLEKRKDHISNLYHAPMPYMMRLTMDGVAIHGSDVREGAGTHGCLGVPLDFGAKLFDHVRIGTEVLVVEDARKSGTPRTQAA
jgi:hypothetical protein